MRICTRCKQSKLESDFNFKIKKTGVRQYHCRDCSRLYVQIHYENNKEYYLTKARIRNKKLRNNVKQYIWNYLQHHNCVDCGENDPIVLEFDHLSNKISAVSFLAKNCTIIKIKSEIKKCEVRCANCHRRKTAHQFKWHKNIMPL